MVEALIIVGVHIVQLLKHGLTCGSDIEKCLIDVECAIEVAVNHDVQVSALNDRIGRPKTLTGIKFERSHVVSTLAEANGVWIFLLVR